jgi:hypothetical protein
MMDKAGCRDARFINKNGAFQGFFWLAPMLLKLRQHIGLQSQI